VLAAPAIVRAQGAPKIRIGFWPVAAGLPFFAAVDKGYFKEAGLDVEPLKFAGAQQVMEGMLAGPLRRQRQRHRLGQPRHRRDRAAGPLQDLLHQPEQRQERARRIHRRQGQPHQGHGRAGKGKRVASGPGIQNVTLCKTMLERAGARAPP
jgi:NitT/TauT family transport system substrate-binding protein